MHFKINLSFVLKYYVHRIENASSAPTKDNIQEFIICFVSNIILKYSNRMLVYR